MAEEVSTGQGLILTTDSKGRNFPTGVEYTITFPHEMDVQVAYQLLLEECERHIEECKKLGIK